MVLTDNTFSIPWTIFKEKFINTIAQFYRLVISFKIDKLILLQSLCLVAVSIYPCSRHCPSTLQVASGLHPNLLLPQFCSASIDPSNPTVKTPLPPIMCPNQFSFLYLNSRMSAYFSPILVNTSSFSPNQSILFFSFSAICASQIPQSGFSSSSPLSISDIDTCEQLKVKNDQSPFYKILHDKKTIFF